LGSDKLKCFGLLVVWSVVVFLYLRKQIKLLVFTVWVENIFFDCCGLGVIILVCVLPCEYCRKACDCTNTQHLFGFISFGLVIGVFGMSLRMSNAFCFSCFLDIVSACLICCVLCASHCFIADPDLCSQSWISMLKCVLSCKSRVPSWL
jgi:hypothetical protein